MHYFLFSVSSWLGMLMHDNELAGMYVTGYPANTAKNTHRFRSGHFVHCQKKLNKLHSQFWKKTV